MKKTVLCKEGYLIPLNNNTNEINRIKKELTVQPINSMTIKSMKKPNTFKVYDENKTHIRIPKYYGLSNFGQPSENKETIGEKVNLKFNSELRDTQKEITMKVITYMEKNDGGVLCLPCGYGKCLAYNTEILMYSGDIKYVQDIVVGDIIMGDDSKERNVLSLGRGDEEMYNINYNSFSYTVNKSHILSLYNTLTGDIIDMSVNKYLANKNLHPYLKGYKVAIQFSEQHTDISPYIYGHNHSKIGKIPNNYKINTINNRMLLLFGIISSSGYNLEYSSEIEIECAEFKKDIIFIAHSCGFNTTINNNIIKINFCKLIDNKYIYDIDVTFAYYGKYYGFEIDGNRRFVLGDFTVTHNTIISLYIAAHFSMKTLVIVHKTFLLNQWKERAEEFTNAKIGIIQRDNIDIENKQIVIGMLQSIAKDKYDSHIFKDFGLVIFDEAHHAPSKYFSQALPIIGCKKTLALSATPKRSDQLEKILYWYFGNIMYKLDTVQNSNVIVNIYNYKIEHEKFREFKMRTGDINRAKTINKITTIGRRNKFIIEIIISILNNRKIIVLSDRVEHLKLLNKRLITLEPNIITSYYIGGMKIDKLKEAEKAQVIFATYSMAAEALDIPDLNTLFMVTPRREIEQAVGRILRKIDINNRPTIYDFIDELPTFVNQGEYRKRYYKKMKYEQNIFDVINNQITKNILDEIDEIDETNVCESYNFID